MPAVPTIAKKALRSEGLLIAVVPLIGSFFAITFEAGYLSFFDIPFEYVEVSFKTIVAFTVALIPVVVLLWLYVALIIKLTEAKHPIWHAVAGFMILGLIPLILFTFMLDLMKAMVIVLMIFILMVIVFVTYEKLSVFIHPITGSPEYRARVFAGLEGHPTGANGQMPNNAVDVVPTGNNEQKESIADNVFAALFVFLTLLGFVFGTLWTTGVRHARLEGFRWVLEEDPSYIVVRNYGDTVILKQYDPLTKKLLDTMQLKKLDGAQPLRLKKVDIGELIENEKLTANQRSRMPKGPSAAESIRKWRIWEILGMDPGSD
jgi:hypothetical protein